MVGLMVGQMVDLFTRPTTHLIARLKFPHSPIEFSHHTKHLT